ncbi:MAG: aminoacetone oxidase family FAD-binding enzyme [Helicobacteraceae bacterium]|nr:aminoacetone oxidase family FAD-binding enzyme [Helicobacteraceae bacterium]
MKIAIIGAGASGIIAAIEASKHSNIVVDLFEKNSAVGKKILASGNGRCNISNSNLCEDSYICENHELIRSTIELFDFEKFEKYFKNLALLVDTKDDGRSYPLSNEASSVVLALTSALKNINILTNTTITKITKNKKFTIHTEEKEFTDYDKVVISSGSQAAPTLGSCSDGYEFASYFKHTIMPTYPSLVGLHLNTKVHAKLSGVKVNAKAKLFINGVESDSTIGDVLFTKYGLSGFAILDISQKASLGLLNHDRVQIALNMVINFTRSQLSSYISSQTKLTPTLNILTLLSGVISVKFSKVLLDFLEINYNEQIATLNSKSIKKIINHLQDWRFDVTQTHGFKHAEVSGGGVSSHEVTNNFESKLVKNLFFSGEVLDVLGKRGGYNLHFAFASGYIVGNHITK